MKVSKSTETPKQVDKSNLANTLNSKLVTDPTENDDTIQDSDKLS